MKWLTHEDLKQMKPETVELLRQHGDLDHSEGPEPADPRITLDDLKTMSPEAVIAARKAGELDHLLRDDPGGPQAQAPQAPAGSADQGARTQNWPKTTREQLNTMTAAEIVDARRRGDLDDLLNGRVR